ncbi:Helicase-like protein [Pleurostoma richardsiae]|uniref:Helicase-like protein n=1 Tax=Pleurostoma richardsiae TaxID=41990 RepID=A0AA38RNX4_9PEZI|nr:Helicase-like protein [Pleurostoma richardsiae]
MATLSDIDIEKLFSGAPQYFARSEGHFTGAPHPSVAFPWDEDLPTRDLTDHAQIEDAAWGCITAWPHITRDVDSGPSAARKVAEKRRAHFYARCRERPNMLSMQGLEKGTMGYQAALELSVADALQEEQFGFDSLGAKARVIVEARQGLITSKDGLRHLEEKDILEQLIRDGKRYSERHLRNRSLTNDLYKELFLKILHPPIRVTDHDDPYSLSVQIQALLKVLATPNVWIDFSHVEWRIRLGQVLWGTPIEDLLEDGASIRSPDTGEDLQEERYWLLLQILLACELLIRLDAITEGDELGMENIKPAEVHRFEKEANRSVKWSLHLARAWLENVEVTKAKPTEPGDGDETPKGWLAALTKKISLTAERPLSQHHIAHHHQHIYAIRGKHSERQLKGLTHFARRLRWPDIETATARISESCRAVTGATSLDTPLATPLTSDTQRSSYFGGGGKGEGTYRENPSRRQKLAAALHPSGWMSKSYISGLMLPGEGLYHFLMSTLLETDREAVSKLGPMANLCGGFVYYGKSFWSTACVVGRVLAAGKGSAECMGWISSDITPQGLGDGWLNIDVEDSTDDAQHTGKKARLWGKVAIERESSILGGDDTDSVFPADFVIPFENIYKEQPPRLNIQLKALNLFAPADSVTSSPIEESEFTPGTEVSKIPEIRTYSTAISFGVSREGVDEDAKEYSIPLTTDVYFVTAHPCVPSHHVRILKSPSSPTIQQIDVSGAMGKPSSTASVTGHPLHKYYTYTSIHLSELLEKKDWTLEQLLSDTSSAAQRPSLTPAPAKPPRVLVIDCMTGFKPQPQAHEIPLSPVTSNTSAPPDTPLGLSSPVTPSSSSSPQPGGSGTEQGASAEQNMHHETRRRQFGSDAEILIRAVCAEKGWNALISRRRRGCLACAIREAGALGWKVIVRVD